MPGSMYLLVLMTRPDLGTRVVSAKSLCRALHSESHFIYDTVCEIRNRFVTVSVTHSLHVSSRSDHGSDRGHRPDSTAHTTALGRNVIVRQRAPRSLRVCLASECVRRKYCENGKSNVHAAYSVHVRYRIKRRCSRASAPCDSVSDCLLGDVCKTMKNKLRPGILQRNAWILYGSH